MCISIYIYRKISIFIYIYTYVKYVFMWSISHTSLGSILMAIVILLFGMHDRGEETYSGMVQ